MKVGESMNGFGVIVSLHRCVYCDEAFSVTPRVDDSFGLGCLGEGCPSYDVARDIDLFWDIDPTIRRIQGEPKVQR